MNLSIITSTTRPGRKGLAVANWIYGVAASDSAFHTTLLDLEAINLPLLDEPNHPRLRQYQHDHTRAWSQSIESSDAFIIVLAEYNNGIPAPIKNAIDYLYHEWRYKPVSFVSYGGISAGLRSLQMLKQVVVALNMMPISEAVSIPFFTKHIDPEGRFNPDEAVTESARTMLKELRKWESSMQSLRGKKSG